MKRIFYFIAIAIILLSIVGGYMYSAMSTKEKYDLKLNFLTDGGLRKEIKKSIYYETDMEACTLNSYQGFPSVNDCHEAADCLATTVSELILKKDLKQIAKDMAQGEWAESTLSTYLTLNPSLQGSLDEGTRNCLIQNGHSGNW